MGHTCLYSMANVEHKLATVDILIDQCSDNRKQEAQLLL